MSGSFMGDLAGNDDEFDKIMEGFEIPDDLSGLDLSPQSGPREPSSAHLTPRAIILTPLRDAEPVVALAVLAGVRGIVIPAQSGVALVLEDVSPDAPERAVATLSTMFPAGIVLLQRAGTHITGHRWESGNMVEEVPAGLILSSVSDEVEAVVVGETHPSEQPHAISTRSMGRFAALRTLRRMSKDNRGEQE